MRFYLGVCNYAPDDVSIMLAKRAAGSLPSLKKRLSETPNTEWNVVLFNVKVDKDIFCALIEDPTQVEVEDELGIYLVNDKGRVRAKADAEE